MRDHLYHLINTGQWPLALAALDGLPSSGNDSAHAPIERGLILKRLGQPCAALGEYLRGLSADPENTTVLEAALALAIEHGDIRATKSLIAHRLSGPFAEASPTMLSGLRKLSRPFGFVQQRDGVASGWAVGHGKTIQAESAGQRAELQASQPSPQLLAAGVGDGANGFAVSVQGASACLRFGIDGASLWGSPAGVHGAAETVVTPPPASAPLPGLFYVLVPVFGDAASLRRCLDALALSTGLSAEQVWVIEDCPVDSAVTHAVRERCQEHGFRLLSRTFNAGFTAAVNSALRVIPAGDVILLNSDTVVCDDWVPRLQAVAYSANDIATVTPLSNNGELLSYPTPMQASALDSVETVSLLDHLCRKNRYKPVDIPTGVGFCLFIRADARQAAGELDEVTFGRGYGEETDYCLRLSDAGWRHVAAPNVFVGHEGSVSFGSERALLAARNVQSNYAKYPAHSNDYAAWLAEDPLQPVRRELQHLALPRLLPAAGLGEVLLGAREDIVALLKQIDRDDAADGSANADADADATTRLLNDAGLPSAYLSITEDSAEIRFLNVPLLDQLDFPHPSVKKTLFTALRTAGLRTLVIRSITPSTLQFLEQCPASFRLVFSLEDASGYCPRGSATVAQGRRCDTAQTPETCDACIERVGAAQRAAAGTAHWRARVRKQFGRARRILIGDTDLGRGYLKHFPDKPIEVSEVVSAWASPAELIDRFGPDARLAVIGTNSVDDGFVNLCDVLLESFRLAPELHFTLIGQHLARERLASFENVSFVADREQKRLAQVLRQHRCCALLVTSLAPGAELRFEPVARLLGLPLVKVMAKAMEKVGA